MNGEWARLGADSTRREGTPLDAEPLADASRCLLAVAGPGWPMLAPAGVWYDGTGLWLSPPLASPHAIALLADPRCAGVVLPAGAVPVVFNGVSRVFGLGDPLGLALHGPSVAAAMAALALRQAGSLVARARQSEAADLLGMLNRVVVRIAVVAVESFPPPAAKPGVAPALPTVVPPEVRRVLAGRRDVVVAVNDDGMPRLIPAAWGARFTLDPGTSAALPPGPATVGLDDGAGTGLRLEGVVDGRGALAAQRVGWWHRGEQGEAPVPPPSAGLELPD